MKRLFIATRVELSDELKAWRTQFKYEMRHDDIVWVKDDVCSHDASLSLIWSLLAK